MKNKINVIVFMGEAGSGKDRLLNETLAANPQCHRVISYTSRPIRENEKEGIDYYYVTPNEFMELATTNSMYEHSLHHWLYGTGIKSYDKNKVNIAVLNPEGIRTLMDNNDFNLKVYWVRAAAKTRLLRQLNRENSPNCDEIIRRYGTDKADFEHINFDYIGIANENEEDLRAALQIVQQDIRELESAPPHDKSDKID